MTNYPFLRCSLLRVSMSRYSIKRSHGHARWNYGDNLIMCFLFVVKLSVLSVSRESQGLFRLSPSHVLNSLYCQILFSLVFLSPWILFPPSFPSFSGVGDRSGIQELAVYRWLNGWPNDKNGVQLELLESKRVSE